MAWLRELIIRELFLRWHGFTTAPEKSPLLNEQPAGENTRELGGLSGIWPVSYIPFGYLIRWFL